MRSYRTPGVYFEWVDPEQRSAQPVRTDIAGFVGIATRGPLHTPVRVESWEQFTGLFGAHTPQGYLAYAVQGFFENGGQTCYIVRVADPNWATCASLDLVSDLGQPLLRLTASSPGVWGQGVTVTARIMGRDRLLLILRLEDGEQEVWRDLSLTEDHPRYAVALLNGKPTRSDQPTPPRSALVTVSVPDWGASGPQDTLRLNSQLRVGRLAGGVDGLWTLRPEHFEGGLATLEHISEVSIVAMPDLMPSPAQPPEPVLPTSPNCLPVEGIPDAPPRPRPDPDYPPAFSESQIRYLQQQLVGHCDKLKNRIAILDARLTDVSPETVVAWRNEFDSKYAALYSPWLRVPDPLLPRGWLRSVPPSGHVAGIYARVEQQVGVHKPPANERLEAAQDVTWQIDDILHGFLNDYQVNVIRSYPGRGLRIMGERTLSSDTLWRYVNVRRLVIMIERAVDQFTQWMVFEPNDRDLQNEMDRVVRSFLDDIWRRGMLDGASAAEAYRVICDRTSNPPEETELGRIICVVGVQPPWPAEFVVVRIGKTEGGVQVMEEEDGRIV